VGRTAMSTRELKRAGVLARVAAGTLRLGSAAVLMAVSYRQAKRLYRRYQRDGSAGLKHGSAGRASNQAIAAPIREQVLALVREKYGGAIDERFGPTLAAEHLATEDGLTIDHETLRRWMLAAGLWSRARKRRPHRRRRARKAHFGELVQMDGSFHPWFEGRGPASCLLTLVDDATGTTLGRLGAQETIWAAVAVLRAWIGRYGIPHALYTDWKNVYVRGPNASERVTGVEPLTQFGRMCATLGIQIIPASSPQAKGRIERNHGTQQDRLVKKMRRHGIADLETANAFLETAYWAEHNTRFAQAPAATDDFHLPPPPGRRLDQVFQLEEARTVSNDWVVRYDNRCFQLERQSRLAPARSTVQVREDVGGQIEIRYRDRPMRWTEIVGALATESAPAIRRERPAVRAARRSSVPCADHPWRHAVEEYAADRQRAAERRARAVVEP
jgi:transposase